MLLGNKALTPTNVVTRHVLGELAMARENKCCVFVNYNNHQELRGSVGPLLEHLGSALCDLSPRQNSLPPAPL